MEAPQAEIPGVYTADGLTYRQWYRSCPSGGQVAWVPDVAPEDLAQLAFDDVKRLVPKPTPSTSPDFSVGGFVGLETWLGVEPIGAVSATAGPLPNGLSATTTATPVEIVWSPGDGSTVRCALWGGLPSPSDIDAERTAPCGWVPQFPSAPQFNGGSDDLAYRGSITLRWSIAWSATDGSSGDLGEFDTSTTYTYRVREIQTIGEDR